MGLDPWEDPYSWEPLTILKLGLGLEVDSTVRGSHLACSSMFIVLMTGPRQYVCAMLHENMMDHRQDEREVWLFDET